MRPTRLLRAQRPQGIGFLWGRKDLLESLRPLTTGSQAAVAIDRSTYELEPIPYRYEAGILNTAGLIGFGAALQYVETIGVSNTESYVSELTDHLLAEFAGFDQVDVYGESDRPRTGIVSWNVQGKDAGKVAQELYERKRIIVSAGSCGSPLALQFLVPRVFVG